MARLQSAVSVAFLFLVCFCRSAIGLANEGAPPEPPELSQKGDEADAPVDRILAVIEVALKHHIDPPTRQQMVVEAATALTRPAGDPESYPPSEPSVAVRQSLAREVSDLTTRAELRAFLVRCWNRAVSERRFPGVSPEDAAVSAICRCLGASRVTAAKDYAVNRQFAANQYVGIGIALSRRGGAPLITSVIEGGPAAGAGALVGDMIEEIDGTRTAGLEMSEVIDRLRDAAGTEVHLALRQEFEEEQRRVTMTRSVVPQETVTYERLRADGAAPLAHIRIGDVNASAPHELRRIEQTMPEEIAGVVLDLRQVGGSDPHYGVLLANAFLDGGAIGSVEDQSGRREFTASRDCVFREMPMVVLVDGNTSGTAEWVAAALQENGRCVVVGERTAGAGYVMDGRPVPGTDEVLFLRTGILFRSSGQPLTGREQPVTIEMRDLARMQDMLVRKRTRHVLADETVVEQSHRYGESQDVLNRAAALLRERIKQRVAQSGANHPQP